ncbi:MAG TPA: glycosyltransferase family 61 protein [Acetobacteraceae bacterium]|nr:glycosyltransferase family 61 protein [Acetobacteraceae bacterium]
MQPSAETLIRPLEGVGHEEAVLLPACDIALPNPLIHTNLTANDPFRHRLLTVNAARFFSQPAVALYRYPVGTLVDGDAAEPYIVLSDGALVRQQLPDWVGDPDLVAAGLKVRAVDAPCMQRPCLLAARYGDVTWGHWVHEMLAKIVLAEWASPQRFTYVVPTRTTLPLGIVEPAYVEAVLGSLAAYGIAPERIVRLPPGQPVAFDALYDLSGIFPLAGQEFFSMHPDLIDVMGNQLAPSRQTETIAKPYLLRRPGDVRQIANEDGILGQVRRHGMTPVDMATLDFSQQARIFADAKSIAGALGSAFSAILFAPPELPVLTLAPTGWHNHYFVNLFQKRTVLHADIRGTSDFSVEPDAARSPFAIEPQAFDDGVEALQSRRSLRAWLGGVRFGKSVLPRRLGRELFALTFGTGGTAAKHKRDGWSFVEREHTWSVATGCGLEVYFERLPKIGLWLEAEGFSIANRLKAISLSVNGEDCGERSADGQSRLCWFVPPAALARKNPASIRFTHEDSPSPKSLGLSEDDRPLGFGFVRLSFFRIAPRE